MGPASFIEDYDVSHTPEGAGILDETQGSASDRVMAMVGPWLEDPARSDGALVGILGLANDQIGYLLRGPDLAPFEGPRPGFIGADGRYCEETNSTGINGRSRVKALLEQLLAWGPEGD